jgi:superfamily II DNA or RNA helicase
MAEKTNNLLHERNGVFDVAPGAGITSTIAEAIERATRERRSITFNFSGVPVMVVPESDPGLIRRDMQRAWERLHSGS